MVNKLFEHIGTKVVLANPWLDTYSVNCIELPLKDGEKRIVNIEGDEKEDFSINDVSGNGFYIKINPRFTYTEQRQVSSSQKDFLVSIRFRFVFFGINTEIEYSKLGLENKFGTAFRNISFSDYIGNERSIKLNISQTNIDAVQIFNEEVGKDYDFGAESVFIALDGVLSFLSTDNYCDSECGIAVSESTLKTLDFCDPAIIALLNAKQRECLENEFGGGGLTCEDLSTCQVITEIQSDLATETSERISEDAALLALIQAIAPTLAQVLANGNATNETSILSNNGKSQMKANNAESLLRFIDGVTSGGLTNNFSKTKIDHTSEVEIDSPLIRLVIGHLEGNLLKAKLALLDNQSSLTFDDLTVISGVVADIARHESFFFDGTVYASLKHETAKSSFVHPTLIELTAPTINLPQSTASRIVETDASKNLTYAAKGTAYNKDFGTTAGTVLEGDRITQTITNGVTDKAPSEDAVYDALATKQNTLTNPVTGTGTSNEIAYWSASNTIGSLAVATYPSLTELSYVKGITSAVQTQINNIRRSYQIITGTLAPADSTTYYSNATSDISANWSTNIAVYKSQIPITGTIKECSIIVFNNNSPTSEASTLILRNLTTSTDYTLSNGVTFDSTNGVWKPLTIITGLNIPISAGDNFVLKLTTPAWSANPTSIRIAVNLSISL